MMNKVKDFYPLLRDDVSCHCISFGVVLYDGPAAGIPEDIAERFVLYFDATADGSAVRFCLED